MLISPGIMHPASGREILPSRGVRTGGEPILPDHSAELTDHGCVRAGRRGHRRVLRLRGDCTSYSSRRCFLLLLESRIRHPTARRPVTGARLIQSTQTALPTTVASRLRLAASQVARASRWSRCPVPHAEPCCTPSPDSLIPWSYTLMRARKRFDFSDTLPGPAFLDLEIVMTLQV